MKMKYHIQQNLLVLTADPVSFNFRSAANIAAIVLSETCSLWSTDFTFSFTTESPTVSFSVSPTLLSNELTFADALAVNWCFSSNALALFTASCFIADPFASIFVTTSCALLRYTLPPGFSSWNRCRTEDNKLNQKHHKKTNQAKYYNFIYFCLYLRIQCGIFRRSNGYSIFPCSCFLHKLFLISTYFISICAHII